MEITHCFNCFSEKICWKMLFNIKFQFQFLTQCFCFDSLVVVAWSPLPEAEFVFKCQQKKSQNLNLKNFFQQVLLEYVFI